MAKHIYHVLNKIQTHLITWGDPFSCNGKDTIICVTGNPGMTIFYEDFGSMLHEITKLPLCIVGQSGHEVVPDAQSNKLKGQEHLFNLQAQLHHKLNLINKIAANSKVHLIGHSIGAWMLIEILHTNPTLIHRVKSVNLLFPTIQKLAVTTSGVVVHKLLRYVHSLALFIITLFSLLPENVRTFLIYNLFVKWKKLPSHQTDKILEYLNPIIIEKVLFLAYDEMDLVVKLNVDGIDKIKHLTYVTYGSNDHWAPLSYMDDLKAFQPELKMKEVNIDHAFVLKSSETVAEMVAQNIIEKI